MNQLHQGNTEGLRELTEHELKLVSGGDGETLNSGIPPNETQVGRGIRVDRAYRK
jgi:bacteriocin-like protein